MIPQQQQKKEHKTENIVLCSTFRSDELHFVRDVIFHWHVVLIQAFGQPKSYIPFLIRQILKRKKENWNRRPKLNLITPPRRGHRNKERFGRKKKEKRPRKYTSTFPVCSTSAPLFHIDISIYLLSRFFCDLFFPFRLVGCERICHNVLFHMWLSYSLLLHRSVFWPFLTSTVLSFYNPDWSIRHIVASKSPNTKNLELQLITKIKELFSCIYVCEYCFTFKWLLFLFSFWFCWRKFQ